MEVNAKRAFELLNKLSFERVSCTAEETRTAEALLAEIIYMGAFGHTT